MILVKLKSILFTSKIAHLGNLRFLSSSKSLCSESDHSEFRHPEFYGGGKTSVNVLNLDPELGLMVDAISPLGFRLNNGFKVIGAMAIFPRCLLSWKVKDLNEITPQSLSLFSVLEPKLDILIIGTGDTVDNSGVHTRIIKFLKQHKINVEILTTENACAVFNFLNIEGRCIAGAFIPPTTVNASDDDLISSKLRYDSLYKRDD